MTRELISKKTGTVILIRPSLLRIMVSLLLELGRNPSKPLRCQGVFCWDVKALSLQLGQISLQFPKLQGETGWLQTASTAN
jgi:hypothetical protein